MRLINVHTEQLEKFDDERNIPGYAILSHTWGKDEVTFEDLTLRPWAARKKESYSKISNTCRIVVNSETARGCGYVWIDTCCIDKSSSAELSEAINSMYRWYERSITCIVHLEDASADLGQIKNIKNNPIKRQRFGNCRWFHRGWTLQELIAPLDLEFYNDQWSYIGHLRPHYSFISDITGIDEAVLANRVMPQTLSVAKRLSWAANRRTTRVEDEAYSLLGFFDINMPLVYGEGKKAFIRLQEEIIKSSHDLSIFAWQNPRNVYGGGLLLAPSASCFANSGTVIPLEHVPAKAFRLSNRGLENGLSTGYMESLANTEMAVASLDCRYEDDFEYTLALDLSTVNGLHVLDFSNCNKKHKQRLRLLPLDSLARASISANGSMMEIIQRYRPQTRTVQKHEYPRLWIQSDLSLKAIDHIPDRDWNHRTRVFTPRLQFEEAEEAAAAGLCIAWDAAFALICVAYNQSCYTVSITIVDSSSKERLSITCSLLLYRFKNDTTTTNMPEMRIGTLRCIAGYEVIFTKKVLVLRVMRDHE